MEVKTPANLVVYGTTLLFIFNEGAPCTTNVAAVLTSIALYTFSMHLRRLEVLPENPSSDSKYQTVIKIFFRFFST